MIETETGKYKEKKNKEYKEVKIRGRQHNLHSKLVQREKMKLKFVMLVEKLSDHCRVTNTIG